MCILIPASQKVPSGDLQEATRSGCLEFIAMQKSPDRRSFSPHDFLRRHATPSWLTRSREGTKPWRA
jgi:hypothetical protein